MKTSVLLIGNFLSSPSASFGVCQSLAPRLAALGWPVLTSSARAGRLARVADMISTAWSRRSQYEVAHVDVYSGPAFLWAEAVCWVLRRARKPFLLTLHGGNLPAFARGRTSRVRSLLRSAAVVTTPSGYLRDQMRPYRDDLRLVPNPLDLSAYSFHLRERPQPRIIWLRAFHQIYNPALAPKVLAALSQKFPDARLTMIGPDKRDGSLKLTTRIAGELGVTGRLTLPGVVPKFNVPESLNRADVFLNTSNVDNAPVSILEAMACGLCIVSTNIGGIPHLLEDGKDALLVPPNDPDAMAAAVRRILTEPGLGRSLSLHARAKAEESDWSVLLPQWQTLLASAASGSRQ